MTATAPTTTTNTELVAGIFEAFGRGDVPHILRQLHDDVRFTAHLDESVPWSGRYDGKDEVLGYFQALGGSVEVGGHPVGSIIADGDAVVATGDVAFTVRATGQPGSSAWVYIWRVRDGRIASFDQFNDPGLATAFREG